MKITSSLALILFSSAANAQPSSFCVESGIARLSFNGVTAVPNTDDFCKRQASEVPPAVMSLLHEIRTLNENVARTIGQTFQETFQEGVSLALNGSSSGSLDSYTLNGTGEIIITVFPDADLKLWPKQSYAHELTHSLIKRKTEFSKAVTGLTEHPLIEEGLPDLVSLTSQQTPVFRTEDQGLPGCLQINRDATPLKSFNDKLKNYTLFAPSDSITACCNTLTPREKNPHTFAICTKGDPSEKEGFYGSMPSFNSNLTEPNPHAMAMSFDPQKCLYQMKGWNVLGACNTHQFAIPLVSFFFSLNQKFGRSFVADWISILKSQAATAKHYQCRYVNAVRTSQPAELTLRGLAPSLAALRNKLSAAEKAQFDRIWTLHGMNKVSTLDSLFMEQNRKVLGLAPLMMANLNYASAHNCSSPFVLDPVACDLECK